MSSKQILELFEHLEREYKWALHEESAYWKRIHVGRYGGLDVEFRIHYLQMEKHDNKSHGASQAVRAVHVVFRFLLIGILAQLSKQTDSFSKHFIKY